MATIVLTLTAEVSEENMAFAQAISGNSRAKELLEASGAFQDQVNGDYGGQSQAGVVKVEVTSVKDDDGVELVRS